MVNYNFHTQKVTQTITSLSFYDLESSIDEVIKKFKDIKACYFKKPIKIKEIISYSGKGEYLDGEKEKTVVFNKIFLELSYGEDRSISIKGERDFLPEELFAWKEKTKQDKLQQEEREKAQLLELKKKFPNL